MSSRSRISSDLRPLRAAVLLLALLAMQCCGATPALAAVPLPVAAVILGGGQTSLVVDLSASTRAGRRTVAVTRDGTPQQARLIPVMSDGFAVTLVVDTSAAGAASLPAWLSAAARFILEAPADTPAVVITGGAPAQTITGPQRGPIGIVAGLDSVRAKGDRDTAAALTLATRQFPAAPAGRRVVVLYTTAHDAGGDSAAAVSARFRTAGVILVVVGTAEADAYWANAAADTGGFFAPAGDPVVVPALDQVETTLRGRYLVQFPTPPKLPAVVSVRVETADLTLSGDALVAAPPEVSSPGPDDRTVVVRTLIAPVVLLALIAVTILFLRRRPRDGDVPGSRAATGPYPAVAIGRAAVPGVPAVGRARVPPNSASPADDQPG